MSTSDETSLEDFSPEEYKNMGKLYATLVKDPTTRELTLRATKKVAPGTAIPEIDVLDRVGSAVKPHLDKISALEKRELERDVKERIREKREALSAEGFSRDEIDSVEKLMVEKQIPDYKTAGEFFRLQSKSAAPTPASYVAQNRLPVDKAKFKEAGGSKKYFIQDAHQAVDDIRAGRIKLNS